LRARQRLAVTDHASASPGLHRTIATRGGAFAPQQVVSDRPIRLAPAPAASQRRGAGAAASPDRRTDTLDSYASQHRNRLNLLVHLLMVPQFVIACAGLLIAIAVRHAELGTLWASIALLSFLGQHVGHLFEEHHAEPSRGPRDFIERWFVEQFYVFPKFVLSGRWWRSFRDQ